MIGLDISSSSVKLVELGQSGSGEFVLERFGSESFEKGWISDGQIEKFDEVAEAVKRLVTKSGTRTRQVVIAMAFAAVASLPEAIARRLGFEDLAQIESLDQLGDEPGISSIAQPHSALIGAGQRSAMGAA